MPKSDEPAEDKAGGKRDQPTREEILAATEAANAARALDGHVAPKHIDVTPTGE